MAERLRPRFAGDRRIHLSLLAVLGATCVLVLLLGIPRNKYPSLEIEERIVDFGVLPSQVRETRIVEVHNRGDEYLEITGLRTGCGCTELAIANRELAPHQSTELRITQTGQPGRQEMEGKTDIYLFSNDPHQPVYHLVVLYHASEEVLLEPTQIDFGQVDHTKLPATRTGSILGPNRRASHESITEIITGVPFIHATLESSSDSRGRDIRFVLGADAPLGELFYPFQILEEEGKKSIEANVIGNVRGWCFAVPQAIDFGKVSESDEAIVEVVRLRNRDKEGVLLVKEVVISEPLAPFVLVESRQTDRSTVSVSLLPHRYRGTWSTQQHCGYFKALCSDSSGRDAWVAVPFRFQMIAPKVRDMPSQH